MAEHQKKGQKNKEDTDQKRRLKPQEPQTSDDYSHAWEQGQVAITETPFWPRMDEHAELLSRAPSGEHRASLVLHLQQTYGNRYVQRLMESMAVQAKLTVSQPDDVYEREANRVAEMIQCQAKEEEELQMKASQVQRQAEE